MRFSGFLKRLFHPQPEHSLKEETTPAPPPSLSDLLPFHYEEISRNLTNDELLDKWASSFRPGIHPMLIIADEQLMELLSSNRWETDSLPDLQAFFEEAEDDLSQDENASLIIGESGDPGDEMSLLDTPAYHSGAPLLLAEIPAQHPWDIFRLLPVGGWNACPDASVIAAFCKLMHDQWGALPVLVSGDLLILKPERLPDAPSAYDLALKMYAFCPDMVAQVAGSIHALQDSLTKSPLWAFWWD